MTDRKANNGWASSCRTQVPRNRRAHWVPIPAESQTEPNQFLVLREYEFERTCTHTHTHTQIYPLSLSWVETHRLRNLRNFGKAFSLSKPSLFFFSTPKRCNIIQPSFAHSLVYKTTKRHRRTILLNLIKLCFKGFFLLFPQEFRKLKKCIYYTLHWKNKLLRFFVQKHTEI